MAGAGIAHPPGPTPLQTRDWQQYVFQFSFFFFFFLPVIVERETGERAFWFLHSQPCPDLTHDASSCVSLIHSCTCTIPCQVARTLALVLF